MHMSSRSVAAVLTDADSFDDCIEKQAHFGMTLSRSTTETTTPGAATLDGCLGLAVSDASTAADSPEFRDALRVVLAKAAGPEVLPEYVVDLNFLAGSGCDAGRLLFEARRLQQQESLRVDYLIVFPTSLGLAVAVALAETSQKGLETVTVEAATRWLKEEVAQVPALHGLEVAVATKSVALSLSAEAAELVAQTTADSTALLIVIGFAALLFPTCLCVISWRCRKRLAPSAAVPETPEPKLSAEVWPEPTMDVCDIRRTSLLDDTDFQQYDPAEAADVPEETRQLETDETNSKKKRLVPKGRERAKMGSPVAVKRGKSPRRLIPKARAIEEPTQELSSEEDVEVFRWPVPEAPPEEEVLEPKKLTQPKKLIPKKV
ncbi:unnamed protein product, partial [Symbiodinium pilosum]